MTQLGFFIDLTKCTGCQTCTVACKDAHNLEVGRNFRKVLEAESGSWKQDKATGAWHQDVCAYYVSISCNHCADPACVKVCPTKAHFKRKEDGLVVIDTKKCIGCGACEHACPVTTERPEERARLNTCNLCEEKCEFKKRREMPPRALVVRAVNPQQKAVKKFEEKAVDPVGDADFPF